MIRTSIAREANSVDDEAVDAFLRLMLTPRRRETPSLAEALASAATFKVPTPHGDVAAWRLGEGPAVLLVHGRDDDHMLWNPLIAALDASGHPVVAFDLPAHGLSGGTDCIGWEVTDALRAVAAAVGPIKTVVAHSVGSGGVIGAIDEGWKVPRAALIAPPFRGDDRWRRIAAERGVPIEVADRAREVYNARLSSKSG